VEKLGTKTPAPTARNACNTKVEAAGVESRANHARRVGSPAERIGRPDPRTVLAERLGLELGQPQDRCLLDGAATARRWVGFVDGELPDLECQCGTCHAARSGKLLVLHPRCQCSACVATRRMVTQVREMHRELGGLCRIEHVGPGCRNGRVPRPIQPLYQIIRLQPDQQLDAAA